MRYTHSIRNKWVSGCGCISLVAKAEWKASECKQQSLRYFLSPFLFSYLCLYKMIREYGNVHSLEPSYRNTDL